MYVRQLKQFIRNARPDFDERRYGWILDLMRACQKDGFLGSSATGRAVSRVRERSGEGHVIAARLVNPRQRRARSGT